jgi:hypothetical protein
VACHTARREAWGMLELNAIVGEEKKGKRKLCLTRGESFFFNGRSTTFPGKSKTPRAGAMRAPSFFVFDGTQARRALGHAVGSVC